MAHQPNPPASPDSTTLELSRALSCAGGAIQDGNTVECCVICLEAISDPCRAEPCSHDNFDFVCLASWVELKSTCPLCKADVSRIQYTPAPGADGSENPPGVYAVPARPTGPTRPDPGVSIHSRHGSSHLLAWPEWRRRRRERMPAAPSPDLGLERRRNVYRHRLFSLHIGANRINRYSDVAPQDFTNAPHRVSRARMWIRRELQVFDFLYRPSSPSRHQANPQGAGPSSATRRIDNAEFLLEYIIAILKSVDIQGSAGQAENMLSDFLGRDNTRLFLHELRSWLRSPHSTLAQWDREVQYPEAVPSRPAPASGNNEAAPRPPSGDRWRPSGQGSSRKRRRDSPPSAARSTNLRTKSRRHTSPA